MGIEVRVSGVGVDLGYRNLRYLSHLVAFGVYGLGIVVRVLDLGVDSGFWVFGSRFHSRREKFVL